MRANRPHNFQPPCHQQANTLIDRTIFIQMSCSVWFGLSCPSTVVVGCRRCHRRHCLIICRMSIHWNALIAFHYILAKRRANYVVRIDVDLFGRSAAALQTTCTDAVPNANKRSIFTVDAAVVDVFAHRFEWWVISSVHKLYHITHVTRSQVKWMSSISQSRLNAVSFPNCEHDNNSFISPITVQVFVFWALLLA